MLNITKSMELSNMIKESEWFCAIEGIAIAERIYNIYFEEYDCIPQNKKKVTLRCRLCNIDSFVILKDIQ